MSRNCPPHTLGFVLLLTCPSRMMDKMKAEYEALMTCRQKVAERQLPMEIVDAEYQW